MKYMGSKRVMLQNGLGKLLLEMANHSNRVFDPFCGSGIVTWYLAEKTNKQVIAGDLQEYSVVLANAILLRTKALGQDEKLVLNDWLESVHEKFGDVEYAKVSEAEPDGVLFERNKSAESTDFITKAYGGYYFSFRHAQAIDTLLKNLPEIPELRSIALAGLIEAASACVASPGHTAQPFKPREKGLLAINEVWKRDLVKYVRNTIENLSNKHANVIGSACVCNASNLLDDLKENDLVFLDPPYSSVQYSRFYHVLETIARNRRIDVSGAGRYPPSSERPVSEYSMVSTAKTATEALLEKIANAGAKAVFTFPEGEASNKLSGRIIAGIGEKYFHVEQFDNTSNFSTLGGNNSKRPARQKTKELYLKLIPK